MWLDLDVAPDAPAPAPRTRDIFAVVRLYVEHDGEDFTCIGVMWVGPPGSKGWRRMEGKA